MVNERAWALCCRNAPKRGYKDGQIIHLKSRAANNAGMFLSSCMGDSLAWGAAMSGDCPGNDIEARNVADLAACKARCEVLSNCRGISFRESDKHCIPRRARCATAQGGDHNFFPVKVSWVAPTAGGCPSDKGTKNIMPTSTMPLPACREACLATPKCVGVVYDSSSNGTCSLRKEACNPDKEPAALDEEAAAKVAAAQKTVEYHGLAPFGRHLWMDAPEEGTTGWKVKLVDGDLREGGQVMLLSNCEGAAYKGMCWRNDGRKNAGGSWIDAKAELAKRRCGWTTHFPGDLSIDAVVHFQAARVKKPVSGSDKTPPPFGSNWKHVRHVPASLGRWHAAKDQMRGTDVYGTAGRVDEEWSINFDGAQGPKNTAGHRLHYCDTAGDRGRPGLRCEAGVLL